MTFNHHNSGHDTGHDGSHDGSHDTGHDNDDDLALLGPDDVLPMALLAERPDCPHRGSDSDACEFHFAGKFGFRTDFECWYYDDLLRESCSRKLGWPRLGFAAGAAVAEVNYTKARVLASLETNEEGLSVADLATMTGLSLGALKAGLPRYVAAGYVSRSAGRIPTANNSAFRYFIAARGSLWVQWGIENGLIEAADDD